MRKMICTIWLLILAVVTLQAQTSYNAKAKPKVASHPVSMQASMTRGQVLYTTHCLSCHQSDGGGVPNLNPPLIRTSYVLGSKNNLIEIVLNGLDKRLEIDGETYANNMPPLNYLKDQEIADVLTFVRNSFGNKAGSVKEMEVRQVRASLKK
jgi:mono/diheme cytochrome c family protein